MMLIDCITIGIVHIIPFGGFRFVDMFVGVFEVVNSE